MPSGGVAPSAESVGPQARATAQQGRKFPAPFPALPRLSVILQYFRLSDNIQLLAHWHRCAGVELIVHVDSREPRDLGWLNTSADHIMFDPNVHEIRGFNALARVARAPVMAFVQDDMPPPAHCEYLETIERMLSDDPALGAIGWRTWSLTPMNFKWGGAWGANSSAPLRFERRVGAKLNWWRGSAIRAQYAALVDVGPLFVRTSAFEHVGGFNEAFSEPGHNGYYHDWEFSTRLWLSGWRAAFQETRLTGVSCVCFECLKSRACVAERCERAVHEGRTRMRANYADVSTSIARRREQIMRLYRRYYANISLAVGRLNTQLAASNGYEPYRGALVKWAPTAAANKTLHEMSTKPDYCAARALLRRSHSHSCCNVFGVIR